MSNININKLPVPTWTWLKVNECTVAVPEKFEKPECIIDNMPEDVKVGSVDFTSVCLGDVELGAGEEFKKISHGAKTGGTSYTVSAGVKQEAHPDLPGGEGGQTGGGGSTNPEPNPGTGGDKPEL